MFLSHLDNSNTIMNEKQLIKITAEYWLDLKDSKRIKDLKLYYYDFEPQYFFVNLNNTLFLFNLLIPIKNEWGYNDNSIIIFNMENAKQLRNFINDLSNSFSSVINEKTKNII